MRMVRRPTSSAGSRPVFWRVASALALGLLASGCQPRARLAKATEPIEPVVQTGDLPPPSKAPAAPGGTAPWYAELRGQTGGADAAEIIELPALAGEPRASAPVDLSPAGETPAAPPDKPGTFAGKLLAEIRAALETGRPAGAKWSLLRLEFAPRNAATGGGPEVRVDVGLTRAYTCLPEISFHGQAFEQCLTLLAAQAGLRYAQLVRVQNPLVTWRRENVSILDAIQAVSVDHGFAARFTDVGRRLAFELDKYPAREKFLDAVTSEVLSAGRKMDRAIPTVLVSVGVKAPPPATAPAPSAKPVEPESVPAPPPERETDAPAPAPSPVEKRP